MIISPYDPTSEVGDNSKTYSARKLICKLLAL